MGVGVLSLVTGDQNDILQEMAQRHADYQARVGRQGHQNWDSRKRELMRELPQFSSIEEVANESWPGQDEREAAEEMFKSWRKSSGHWGYVNGRCDAWGYAMAYSQQKRTWYACGLFGDRR